MPGQVTTEQCKFLPFHQSGNFKFVYFHLRPNYFLELWDFIPFSFNFNFIYHLNMISSILRYQRYLDLVRNCSYANMALFVIHEQTQSVKSPLTPCIFIQCIRIIFLLTLASSTKRTIINRSPHLSIFDQDLRRRYLAKSWSVCELPFELQIKFKRSISIDKH